MVRTRELIDRSRVVRRRIIFGDAKVMQPGKDIVGQLVSTGSVRLPQPPTQQHREFFISFLVHDYQACMDAIGGQHA
jgi:hypothetical protein